MILKKALVFSHFWLQGGSKGKARLSQKSEPEGGLSQKGLIFLVIERFKYKHTLIYL